MLFNSCETETCKEHKGFATDSDEAVQTKECERGLLFIAVELNIQGEEGVNFFLLPRLERLISYSYSLLHC